jgi:hypothetical protein
MIALRYVGAGTYIHGVPARDLTEAEAAQHGAVIREQETLTGTVMYEPVAQPPAAGSKRGVKAAEEGDNG